MEYNTTRNKLVISEYGRNIQKMIEYTTTIEDSEKRNKSANFIINIMAQMNPRIRESGDYKHKLWDHMFMISDFKLDVDSPYPKPSKNILYSKPEKIPYQDNNIRFRHYGKNIEKIINKAIEYEDGPEKDALIKTIANHLKKSYLNWNRDSVNDELILDHLASLSKDNLKLNKEVRLNNTSEILERNRRKKFVSRKRDSSSNGNYTRSRKK
ncbi:MAG: DUF4290 domain-containing protein [Bacteroidales bacterium]|nr:DUF4290 domain-containing protein [Bacteroidales bacterium]